MPSSDSHRGGNRICEIFVAAQLHRFDGHPPIGESSLAEVQMAMAVAVQSGCILKSYTVIQIQAWIRFLSSALCKFMLSIGERLSFWVVF